MPTRQSTAIIIDRLKQAVFSWVVAGGELCWDRFEVDKQISEVRIVAAGGEVCQKRQRSCSVKLGGLD